MKRISTASSKCPYLLDLHEGYLQPSCNPSATLGAGRLRASTTPCCATPFLTPYESPTTSPRSSISTASAKYVVLFTFAPFLHRACPLFTIPVPRVPACIGLILWLFQSCSMTLAWLPLFLMCRISFKCHLKPQVPLVTTRIPCRHRSLQVFQSVKTNMAHYHT